MSYFDGTPNGKLWLGSVKWSNDYQNVMNFDTKAKRDSFLKTKLKQVDTERVCMSKNGVITVDKYIKNIDTYNYCYFFNDSDISDEPFCCFITDYEYQAPSTTILYVELDVFQMYYYDSTIYKSMIVRTHIPKNEDIVGKWLSPEPISANPSAYKTIGDFSLNFNPAWIVHTTSFYNSETKKYEYGGTSVVADGNMYNSGEYGIRVYNYNQIKNILKTYGKKTPEEIADDVGVASGNQTWTDWVNAIFGGTALSDVIQGVNATTSIADLQDHRDEITGLYAVPLWCVNEYDAANHLVNNKPVSKQISVDFDNTLACGYVPKNNKMLTSLCRAVQVWTENGFQHTFKPELFNSKNVTLKVTASGMGTDKYRMLISNYKDKAESVFEVPYTCSTKICYNATNELDKTTAIFNAGISAVTGVAGMATGGISAVVGAQNLISGTGSLIEQLADKGKSIGSSGDIMSITEGRATPYLIDISPSKEECESIDDFLTCYGYAYNEIGNVKSMANCREKFNYIQTQNINMSCPAPATYESRLKSIFDSGVTLWHDYDVFGNYDVDNN